MSLNMPRSSPFTPMSVDIINKCCLRNRGPPHALVGHHRAVWGLRPEEWAPAHTRLHTRRAYEKIEGCPVHHCLVRDRHAGDQDVDYGIYPTQVYDRRVAREHMSQPLALF